MSRYFLPKPTRLGRRSMLGVMAGAASLPLSGLSLSGTAFANRPDPTILRAMPGQVPLLGDDLPPVSVWTYEQTVPGRLFRIRQGDELRVRFQNRLAEASSVHWHGVRLPNAMDGVPGLTQDPVPPGGEFEYAFTARDAGTFWYHSHENSAQQVARGLLGALIVEEAEPPAVDQDLLMVLDDWRIGEDGQLDLASFGSMHDVAHGGRLGNLATVNGRRSQDFAVRRGDRIRLRLLNGANARILLIRFSGHDAKVVALDGQPMAPVDLPANKPLPLAPAQRADLILDMGGDPGTEAPIEIAFGRKVLEIGRFVYDKQAVRRDNPLDAPIRLPDNPTFGTVERDGALRARLVMEGGAMGQFPDKLTLEGKAASVDDLVAAGLPWTLNGDASAISAEPLFRAAPGRTAIVEVVNNNRWAHAMHSHGHHMQLLSIDGKPLDQAPWRDTVLVESGETVELALVASEPGKWAFHCHMLEHATGGMMTWFQVG